MERTLKTRREERYREYLVNNTGVVLFRVVAIVTNRSVAREMIVFLRPGCYLRKREMRLARPLLVAGCVAEIESALAL